MKMWSKPYKRIVIISIVVGLFIGLTGQVWANSDKIQEKITNLINGAFDRSQYIPERIDVETPPPELTESITIPSDAGSESPIEKFKARAAENRKKRLYQTDEYNFDQQDVEQLLLGGATIEDIYRSDEIGNQWLENPRVLIELKRNNNQTWDEIEEVVADKKKKQLAMLTSKHDALIAHFATRTITTAEKIEILNHFASHEDSDPESVLKAYESHGRKGLMQLHQSEKQGGL